MELLTSLTEYIRHPPPHRGGGSPAGGGDLHRATLMILRRERIVHRDIKPANIFINPSGDFKLGDFGIARTLEKSTSAMSIRGTLAYMAPEVARGEDGDYRIDIYSLGLALEQAAQQEPGPLPAPAPRAAQGIHQRRCPAAADAGGAPAPAGDGQSRPYRHPAQGLRLPPHPAPGRAPRLSGTP